MKRVYVVDDEQHVVDHIVRIVERELVGEFEIVGKASSGRETLEKMPALQPDIVVMDVRMPGLSGLDTVRELQRRGSTVAFVLSTAYERFDIAREALELGVTGYLLKPVSREALVQGLRNAADQLDRRAEATVRGVDPNGPGVQGETSVADAYLLGLMVGRGYDGGSQALRARLGFDKPWGLVAAAAFLHDPERGKADLETLLLYKSQALCGPLVLDRCLILQPLSGPEAGPEAAQALREALRSGLARELDQGTVKLAFADPRPAAELSRAWPQALSRLSGRAEDALPPEATPALRGNFENEEAFHLALLKSDADGLRAAFASLLDPLEALSEVTVEDRYRIISCLGTALARLIALGHWEDVSALGVMDFDDLRYAADGREFCLMARTRLPLITGALSRAQRLSATLIAAMEFIRSNYGRQVTLDSVADHLGVTPKRLSRHFVEELHQGFSDYLIDFRIEKAKVLLSLPGASIKQVSQECGYPDPNYFARLFKKVTGTTPSEFSAVT